MINRDEFLKKKAQLDKASRILKSEYFGIDEVIDQILDAMSSWFFFYELQEKPLVINLWGLTGTGKTSLVKRLFALLEIEKGSFVHDVRNRNGEGSIIRILEAVNAHYQNLPFAILIDEFQHAKTINEKGEEDYRYDRVDLWELLDSGELNLTVNQKELNNMYYLINDLRFKLSMGLKGENGLIIMEPPILPQKRNYRQGSPSNEQETIISDSYYDTFTALDPDRFESESDVQKHLLGLNEKETLSFIEDVYEEGKKPKTINAKKALVFVAGNLDEAFRMSKEVEQEVDADDLYEQSREITLSNIKLALQTRFRNEQIARMGNIHIIYPSLNRKAYESIIKVQLNKVSELLQKEIGAGVKFSKSLLDKIYEEGVSPAQGTRPLFSTIQLWVRGQLDQMLMPVVENSLKPETISLEYNDREIKVDYIRSGNSIFKSSYTPNSYNDRVRDAKEPGLRYIVAVHEAGHIIASIKLLNHIPKNATSLSVSASNDGFVSIKQPKSYYQSDLVNWLATILAGGVAERQVFGQNHVPMGTNGDYCMATTYIVRLLKNGAISEVPGMYGEKGGLLTPHILYDDKNTITGKAEQWLQKGQSLAREMLIRHEMALLHLANELLNKNYLKRDDLTEFARQHLDYQSMELEITSTYEESFKQKLASVRSENILSISSTTEKGHGN